MEKDKSPKKEYPEGAVSQEAEEWLDNLLAGPVGTTPHRGDAYITYIDEAGEVYLQLVPRETEDVDEDPS